MHEKLNNSEAPNPNDLADAWQSLSSVEFAGNSSSGEDESLEDFYRNYVISPRGIHEYPKDRRAENYNLLKQQNPHLAHVYRNLMHEYSSLRHVELVPQSFSADAPNANFQSVTFDNRGNNSAAVHMDFAHPEIYAQPDSLQQGDNFGLNSVLRTIALKVGAKPSDVLKNQNLVAAFTLLHEMGHAHDFTTNYLNPELKKHRKAYDALPKAAANFAEQRNRDLMTQPIPGQTTGQIDERRARFSRRLEAMGIDPNDRDAVIFAQQRSYREMPAESYADNFAIDYIMRHYQDYFVDNDDSTSSNQPNTDSSTTDKTPTHLNTIMNISKHANVLGLDAGKAVKLTPLKIDHDAPVIKNGRPVADPNGHPHEGFLSEPIAKGRRIRLYGVGDPQPENRAGQTRPIDGVYIRPYRDQSGRPQNDIIARFRDSQDKIHAYLVELDPNKTPLKVTVKPEEMLKNLKLSAGSRVQLMKLRRNQASAIDESTILSGALVRSSQWHDSNPNPVRLGHGMHVQAQTKNDVGGNTSAIKRIYRQWNSYFAETNTSVYEIIPE